MDPLMKHEHDQDDIMVWIDLLNTCDKEETKTSGLKNLKTSSPHSVTEMHQEDFKNSSINTKLPSLNWLLSLKQRNGKEKKEDYSKIWNHLGGLGLNW